MHVQIIRKLGVWLLAFTFSLASVTPVYSGSRIIPTGKVRVYEDQKLVQILKKESSFPNGALLTTEGRCAVRLENLYLVAEDGAAFGVADSYHRTDLRVDKGLVYFAIAQEIGNLSFVSPAGVMSARRVLFNASDNSGVLKGYVDVGGSHVQLGVLEGGAMVVSTPMGVKEVRTEKQIILAFADLLKDTEKQETPPAKGDEKKEEKTAGMEEDEKIPTKYFVGGGILAGLLTLGLAGAGGGGGGGGSPADVSPSAPLR